jgi:hypothetical protein
MRIVRVLTIITLGISAFILAYCYCIDDGTEFKGGKVFQIGKDEHTEIDTSLPIEIRKEIDSLNQNTDSTMSKFKIGPKIESNTIYH